VTTASLASRRRRHGSTCSGLVLYRLADMCSYAGLSSLGGLIRL
jgi:hypothetical protein